MIGTIRKHSKLLWIVIIAATVVAFVIFFSPYQRVSDRQGGDLDLGSINGERVSKEDFLNAQREVYLHYFFNVAGKWPGAEEVRRGFNLDRETYFRLLLIQKMKQLDIHVGSGAIAKVAAERLRMMNQGNPVPLDLFVKQVLSRAPQRLTADDFERFIRHDLGIQQLMIAQSVGGLLVTPQDARLLYEREHTELKVEAVFFDASNHLSGITVTPEAVAQFFTNQMARYRLPDRVQVKYVEFPVTNYLAAAKQAFATITNLNEIVEAQYRRLGTNFFSDAKSPEEGREKTREWMLNTNAMNRAYAAANEFARSLFDLEPVRPENLDSLSKEKGLTVRISESFERDYGPTELAVRPDFAKRAFALSTDEPFAGPLVGDDAIYVIAQYKRLPSEIPALETIRERVTAEYKESQALKATMQVGEAFAATVTNGLANGKPFSTICQEAGVRPLSVPPFSLSTTNGALPEVEQHIRLSDFKGLAFSTPPGRSSGFIPIRTGGLLVFVQNKLPVNLTRLETDLPAFMNTVRQMRQNEAFNDWFRKEAEKGLRDVPLFRRPPQMTGSANP